MTDAPQRALDAIRDRLSAGADPLQLIDEMLPSIREGAVVWARRLPGWDEYRDRYPGPVVALARLVSRRAMRAHDPPPGRLF